MTKHELEKLQYVQKEILEAVHNFCVLNNINYQVYAGTLLGAVRHKGFIPWDDDVDIVMIREDYELFLKKANGLINGKYFIQNCETDSNYFHYFTRVRKNNTLALQSAFKKIDMHHGIWIDIFPLDSYPKNNFQQKFFIKKLNNYDRLRALRVTRNFTAPNILFKLAKKMMFIVINCLPKCYLHKKSNKIRTKYNNFSDNVGNFSVDVNHTEVEKRVHNKTHYLNSILYEFEDIEIYGPKDSHMALTKMYGDYMSLPPEENRIAHHGIIEVLLHSEFQCGK